MSELCKCQLCGSNSNLMHNKFPGYQEGMFFKIFFCESCVTSFPMPKVDATPIYNSIYKYGDQVPGYDRYWKYFDNIRKHGNPLQYLASSEEAYWGVSKALSQIVKRKKNTKILEIGSGLGYLTYALRSEDYDVLGLDISQEAVDQANVNFGNHYICQDIFDYSQTNSEFFDIVILTEVIEHVDNPIDFLDAIVPLLKKNGSIVLTTPNKSIAPNDIVWDTEAPPIHHWWFSEDSMQYMANRLCLDLRFINYRDFYNNKPSEYRFGKARKKITRTPILTEDLKLIKSTRAKKISPLKASYKSIIASVPFLKRAYQKLKVMLGYKSTLCSERGKTLCAVFLKA